MKTQIDGDRIIIRKLGQRDAPDIYRNIKDKDIAKWTLIIPQPYYPEHAKRFIRLRTYNWKEKTSYAFGIVLRQSGEVIGVVDLSPVNWPNRNAELGCWLGKRYWGKGYMSEAVNLILKFGFGELKLHRIYAWVFEGNIGSQKMLEKTGFKPEGLLRHSQYKRRRWHNELVYGILRGEFGA